MRTRVKIIKMYYYYYSFPIFRAVKDTEIKDVPFFLMIRSLERVTMMKHDGHRKNYNYCYHHSSPHVELPKCAISALPLRLGWQCCFLVHCVFWEHFEKTPTLRISPKSFPCASTTMNEWISRIRIFQENSPEKSHGGGSGSREVGRMLYLARNMRGERIMCLSVNYY